MSMKLNGERSKNKTNDTEGGRQVGEGLYAAFSVNLERSSESNNFRGFLIMSHREILFSEIIHLS